MLPCPNQVGRREPQDANRQQICMKELLFYGHPLAIKHRLSRLESDTDFHASGTRLEKGSQKKENSDETS